MLLDKFLCCGGDNMTAMNDLQEAKANNTWTTIRNIKNTSENINNSIDKQHNKILVVITCHIDHLSYFADRKAFVRWWVTGWSFAKIVFCVYSVDLWEHGS